MSDSVTITADGDAALVALFEQMPDRVRDALRTKLLAVQYKLRDRIQNDKLTGQVLNVVTGNLRASIDAAPLVESADQIVASVVSRSDVKYGAIHEYGGKTGAHEILSKKASVLAFMMGGKMVFARSVQHPGSVMPERSFMRSSLTDLRPEIEADIRDAVAEGMAPP